MATSRRLRHRAARCWGEQPTNRRWSRQPRWHEFCSATGMSRRLCGLVAVVAACSAGSNTAPDAGTDAGSETDASATDATSCEAPDMLVVLDRTLSMSRRPDGAVPANTPAGHMKSKWYLAVTAVEAIAHQLEANIRFGLELFPRNPNNGTCVTLSQMLGGTGATNATCQAGEVNVPPEIQMGSTIGSFLDPETTQLCLSTPIGAGLATARDELAQLRTRRASSSCCCSRMGRIAARRRCRSRTSRRSRRRASIRTSSGSARPPALTASTARSSTTWRARATPRRSSRPPARPTRKATTPPSTRPPTRCSCSQATPRRCKRRCPRIGGDVCCGCIL